MSAVSEVLSRYGGRAYYVLRAAVEVTEENRRLGLSKLGDFDYRSLVAKLRSWGIEYNPSNLLKILEREYGVVKTVYRSSNQRWWVFTDITSVKLALSEGRDEASGDPDEELLSIQIAVLNVDKIITDLTSILSKEKITSLDERRLREIVLGELPPVVEVYKKALSYGEKFSEFVGKVGRALELAKRAALLLRSSTAASIGTHSEGVIEERLPSLSKLR